MPQDRNCAAAAGENTEAVRFPAVKYGPATVLGYVRLLHGKMRRVYLRKFRPSYVRRSLAARQGSCTRCGVCCRIVIRCPALRYDGGLALCMRYGKRRLPNCGEFPIDTRDIRDRDVVAPGIPCGYSWPVPAVAGRGRRRSEMSFVAATGRDMTAFTARLMPRALRRGFVGIVLLLTQHF